MGRYTHRNAAQNVATRLLGLAAGGNGANFTLIRMLSNGDRNGSSQRLRLETPGETR